MEEFDVGRVLAAAAPAPEAVPPVADLPERARTLGRRRRARRAVMTGGGTGIGLAAVVGAVVAAGGFGSGSPVSAGTPGAIRPTDGPGKPTSTSRNLADLTPASPASSAPSTPKTHSPASTPQFPPINDNKAVDAALTTALNAALPPKWQGQKLYRAAGNPGSYAAEYTWGTGQQEVVLDLSATNIQSSGGTPTLCQENPQHCTSGTATLLGHQVTWTFVSGQAAPDFSVTDPQAKVSYDYMASGGTGTQLPGLDVMKGVGLNNQVASALLEGVNSSNGQ